MYRWSFRRNYSAPDHSFLRFSIPQLLWTVLIPLGKVVCLKTSDNGIKYQFGVFLFFLYLLVKFSIYPHLIFMIVILILLFISLFELGLFQPFHIICQFRPSSVIQNSTSVWDRFWLKGFTSLFNHIIKALEFV